jgi:plasmid stability protein
MALPVEYTVYEGSMVFRVGQDTFTDEDLRMGIAHAEYDVALEIDQIDLPTREGWTVLVRGAAHHVDTEAERVSIVNAGVEPWIEGEPEHVIRINPTAIWGHHIHQSS